MILYNSDADCDCDFLVEAFHLIHDDYDDDGGGGVFDGDAVNIECSFAAAVAVALNCSEI